MLFEETITTYCETYTQQINKFCGKNSKLLNVEVGGT